MRLGKKALNFNFLLALAIFITVMSILITTQAERMTVEDHTLGSAQFALLQVGQERAQALTYMDEAARQAGAKAAERFRKQGGVEEDYEGGGFPCGTYLDTPAWKTPNDECIPDFEANLKSFFNAALFPKLNAQADYRYPHFSLNAKPAPEEGTTIAGRGTSQASITFTGGSTGGMTLSKGLTFSPDHYAATVTETLAHGARGGHDVEFVVVHYTASGTLDSAVTTLRNTGNSYHYLIGHDGDVHQYVPESKSAYHAGCKSGSNVCERPGSNQPSIGISFVNCGHKEECGGRNSACAAVDDDQCWEPYTDEQIESFVNLVADLARRHEGLLDDQDVMPEDKLVMHSDIKTTKPDPGPAFEDNMAAYLSRINTAIKNQPEKVPLGETQQEDQTSTPQPGQGYSGASLTREVQERIESHKEVIETYADKHGLEPAILKAFIAHESRGKADAESPTGALGLMQIVPGWHHDTRCVPKCGFSEDLDKEDYFDPEKNICCGADFIAELSKKDPIAWDCCGQRFDQDICISTTYVLPYEIAARRYNTGRCEEWADPNFVEDVMGLYEFFGGSPAQFYQTERGAYHGTQSFQASFDTTIDIDLQRFESFESFAEEASTCTDNTEACVDQALERHNDTTPDPYNLTTKCFEPAHAQGLVSQLSGCLQAQPGTTCELETPTHKPRANYDLIINRTGVWVHSEVGRNWIEDWLTTAEDPLLVLPGNEYAKHLKTADRPIEANITFRFAKGDDKVDVIIETAQGKEKHKNEELEEDSPLTFTRLEKGLAYGQQGDAETWKPYRASRVFCTREAEPTRFALTLKDRIPTPIAPFDYEPITTSAGKQLGYLLRWEPETRYPDGTEIPDIKEYRVYCSYQTLPTGDPLPEEALSYTLTMKDDSSFSASTGFGSHEFTLPLLSCGGKAATGKVSVAIVPVDATGQYDYLYAPQQLTSQGVDAILPSAITQPQVFAGPFTGLKVTPNPYTSLLEQATP